MALPRIGWKPFAAAAVLALAATPSSAGVVNGVKTVDDLTVYLGVVPAGLVRGHEAELAAAVQGGLPRSSVHNVHLVAAVFNKTSGERLGDIQVRARISSGSRTCTREQAEELDCAASADEGERSADVRRLHEPRRVDGCDDFN